MRRGKNKQTQPSYSWDAPHETQEEETSEDFFAEDIEDQEPEELLIEVEQTTGYASPLMQRITTSRLTVDMLQKEIPKVKKGEEARNRLAKATKRLSEKSRMELLRDVQEGDAATERLFAAALPLIRTVAAREWRRRQQWGSQVSLEDLTQESIIGFLKGISGFKTESIGKSATNYLGQWMLVETRRAAEVLDHDLQVGHDAGERFRRVRALRTRLAADLGREPTDEEIAEASRNPDYVTRPGMVGRAPKEGEERQVGKGLTPEQVAEERTMRGRVGRMARFSSTEEAEENGSGGSGSMVGLIDPAKETVYLDAETDLYSDPAEQFMSMEGGRVIAVILVECFNRLNMPDLQREIISRKYGLPPHQESSAREIARVLGLQRDKVSRVLAAFAHEMVRRGGVFHAVIKDMDEDDLRAVGLGWALDNLKTWPKSRVAPPAAILTEIIVAAEERLPNTQGDSRASGVLGWFICDYHDRTFSGLYKEPRNVPKTRPCPQCQRPSQRIKIQKTGVPSK